ncbi:MAG: 1-acyl-sn-glycerol-3-phosphate acyltransferase, partial [Hyphomicrobium sp.]
VFIKRQASQSGTQSNVLRERLEDGQNIILFAEGTSTDGTHVLPFKSSLFSIVEKPLQDGQPIYIQPVSITAIALDYLPMGRTLRPLYAWYGNMTLGGHGWPMLKLGRMTVAVEFHPAVRSTDFKDRKTLANYCTQMAQQGVARAVTGRDPALKMLPAPIKDRATPRPKQEA